MAVGATVVTWLTIVDPQLPSEDARFKALRSKARVKVDSIRTQLRKDSRSEEIGDAMQQLSSSQAALETCLTMIQLYVANSAHVPILTATRGWSIKAHQVTSDSLTGLRGDFAASMIQLQSQILSLQRQAPPESPLHNKIYQAPMASDLFTGRLALLNEVEAAFNLVTYPALHATGVHSVSMKEPQATRPAPLESERSYSSAKLLPASASNYEKKQKRFILVGLGGSGKTEFCRKFAEQNQPR